jgi:hypothetical protein
VAPKLADVDNCTRKGGRYGLHEQVVTIVMAFL